MLGMLTSQEYMLDLWIRMAHHSTALEGNTLTQAETASILLDNFISSAISEREFYEVRNYKDILPLFIQKLKTKQKLDNELIKEFHRLIMRDLIDNNGEFKKIENMIVGADFEPTKPYLVSTSLKDLLENLYYRLEHSQSDDEKIRAILEFHITFERIHPFSDGNGRTGRLLMVYSCFENNLIPIVITKEQKSRYISILRTNNIEDFFKMTKEIQEYEKERIEKFINVERNYNRNT